MGVPHATSLLSHHLKINDDLKNLTSRLQIKKLTKTVELSFDVGTEFPLYK